MTKKESEILEAFIANIANTVKRVHEQAAILEAELEQLRVFANDRRPVSTS